MIFADVKAITIPEGAVKKIECNGAVLWEMPSTEDSYLEFDGSFYLKSSYVPTADTRVVVDFSCANNVSTNLPLFGSRKAPDKEQYLFWTRIDRNKTVRLQRCYSVRADYGTYFLELSDASRYILDTEAQTITENGTTILQMAIEPDFEGSTYPLYVGAVNNANASNPVGSYKFVGKIYSFKIYEGSELVANYLPDGDTLTDSISGTSMTVA